MLPSRSPQDEAAFVAELASAPSSQVIELITEAMNARRIQLAAKMVALLDQDEQIPADTPLGRAKKAISFTMLRPSLNQWSEADEAWEFFIRSRRKHRIKTRMRPDKKPQRRRPWMAKPRKR